MAVPTNAQSPTDRLPGARMSTAGMSRRGFLKLASLAVASAALTSCLPSPPTAAPSSGQKVQLVYQDWSTDWFPPMAQEMLDQFHATHPNIRVFYTRDPDDVETRMLTDMEAGTAPDVFQGCCSWFPILAQKGHTLDLAPYVRADVDRATIEDWDRAQYEALRTSDGKQYGLPKYHGALALYFNRDLFDEHHVDYPDSTWNHDDYLAAMKRLTRDRNLDGRIDLWGSILDVSWDRIQMHVNGWGGNFVDPKDPAKCLMGEPEALAALEWLRARMWDDKVMAALDMQKIGTQRAFISGQVAMAEDGSWALKEILSKSYFRVGIAPFPAGPVRRVTLASTDAFGIYAGTKHPEAAWELVKFLISERYGRAMAKASFLQPARASLVDEWVAFIREEFPEKSKGVDIAAFADGHIKGYSVTTEVLANMADSRDIAYQAWDRILTLGQAPTSEMKDAAQRIQAAQKTAGSARIEPCREGCAEGRA